MTVRRGVRTAIESAARWTGLLARCEARARGRLTILTYHRVLPDDACGDAPFPSLVMPESAFAKQVAILVERWRVLPVGEALARLAAPDDDPRPLASITFDDGYRDNHDVAAARLAQHGARATFFVVSDFVGGAGRLWYDRAAAMLRRRGVEGDELTREIEALKLLPAVERERRLTAAGANDDEVGDGFAPMSRAQVQALAGAGHEIGAHSATHAILTRTDDLELERELVESRRALEAWVGRPVTGLAYPNGDHDERVVARARAAGYAWACTTVPGRNAPGHDPMRLRRVDVTPARVEDHRGAFSPVGFRSEISLLRAAWRRGGHPS